MIEQMKSHTIIPFDKIDPSKYKVGGWSNPNNPEASQDEPKITIIKTKEASRLSSHIGSAPELREES